MMKKRWMSKVGRNELCPCGSGVKYKRCCEAKERPLRIAAFSQRERDDASAMIHEAVLSDSSPFLMDARFAQIEFFGEDFGRYDEADQERAVEAQACSIGFATWLAFDRPVIEELTVSSLLLESPNAKLSRGERVYLERMSRSRMGLYEVLEVRPEEGLTLVDRWSRERIEVSERAATRSLVRYDCIATRLMEGPTGAIEIDGAVYPFGPAEATGLLKDMRAEWKRFARAEPAAREDRFLKRYFAPIINRYWIRAILLRPLPSMATTDGEPIEFCRVIFDVVDTSAVDDALGKDARFSIDDGDSYVWLDPKSRTVLGTGTLTAKRLTFETMSRKRAEGIRELLATVCPGATRYRLTEHTSVEQALAQAAEGRPQQERTREIPPELESELLAEFQERHYREWLDEPLPALRGRTPRHAVSLKTLRPGVVELLKDFERHAERERLSGRPAYDFSWLWRELGIEAEKI